MDKNKVAGPKVEWRPAKLEGTSESILQVTQGEKGISDKGYWRSVESGGWKWKFLESPNCGIWRDPEEV